MRSWNDFSTKPGLGRIGILLALLCISYGGGNTSPSGVAPSGLSEGTYVLNILAPAGSQGCESPWEQQFLSTRTVFLTLTRDNTSWIGRPTSPFSEDLVVRLQEAPLDALQVAVSGSIQGTLVVARESNDVVAIGATFAPSTPVSGTVFLSVSSGMGTIGGSVIDSQRSTMRCPGATWRLQRSPT